MSYRPLAAIPSFTKGVGHPFSSKILSVSFDSDGRQEIGRRGKTQCQTSCIYPRETILHPISLILSFLCFYYLVLFHVSVSLPPFFLSPPHSPTVFLQLQFCLPFLLPLCIWVDDWTSSCGTCKRMASLLLFNWCHLMETSLLSDTVRWRQNSREPENQEQATI